MVPPEAVFSQRPSNNNYFGGSYRKLRGVQETLLPPTPVGFGVNGPSSWLTAQFLSCCLALMPTDKKWSLQWTLFCPQIHECRYSWYQWELPLPPYLCAELDLKYFAWGVMTRRWLWNRVSEPMKLQGCLYVFSPWCPVLESYKQMYSWCTDLRWQSEWVCSINSNSENKRNWGSVWGRLN